MTSTPNIFDASTMSLPDSNKDTAEPCHVSPPSRSKEFPLDSFLR